MNNNENQSRGVIILWVIRIITIINAGRYAWDWIEPESFFGAVKFLLAWGFCIFIAELLLAAFYFSLFKK